MADGKTLKVSIAQILVIAAISIGFIAIAYRIYSPAFSAVNTGSTAAQLSLFISHSAGFIGTFVGILFTSFLYTLNEQCIKEKVWVFTKAFLGITTLIICFAAFNEKITKPLIKAERPSHIYMLEAFEAIPKLDSVYLLSKSERVNWFSQQVQQHSTKFNSIHPRVLAHWLVEGGYSFPSGHTFNAFLLAMIFAFGISNNNIRINWRSLFPAPFVWAAMVALSRIALGVHTIYDVLAGASLGALLGALLLWLDQTRNLITHKKFRE